MDQTRGSRLSIADQACLLLDDPAAQAKKHRLEIFSSMDATVLDSLGGNASMGDREPSQDSLPSNANYIVASRLGRNHYEDKARKEAIMSALQSLRSNGSGMNSCGRVIRSQ
jgi:hypothetical protein